MRVTQADVDAMNRRVEGRRKFVIGIDPGRTTGYAFFSHGEVVACESDIPIRVEERVLRCFSAAGKDLFVVIEDSRGFRLPKSLQSSSSRDKGVGSVWAEMTRWQEFMEHHGIPHRMQPPTKGIPRKTTSEQFKKDFPTFKGKTNHNARDAAYLGRHFS